MEDLDLSSKESLRRHFRQQRLQIQPAERKQWDDLIAGHILQLPRFTEANVLFSYLSRGGEVATKSIILAALTAGKRVLTPSPDMRALPQHGFHVALCDAENLQTQQCTDKTPVSDIDIILVPGIAWDRQGHRIGFGGGYFDRLLAEKHRQAIAIGMCYDLQLIDKAPSDPWDQPVDLIVTQSGVISTS